jgi:PAS domain S-box-containing protein
VLVQTAPAAIVIHGADGKLLRCNALAERLLGISKRRASGKTLKDRAWHFLREDGTPMPVEEYPVALVLKRQAPLANYVCGIQHAGKKTVWVLVNAQPRFDGDGALADITVAFIDITARKQAQDELQRLNATLEQRVSERTAALQAREERFRGVVQDQTELICRFGADGKVRFVNEVFCRFFGKTASQLIGQRWHPHALAEDLPRIESELGKLTKKNPVVVIENRVYNGPGELRWMQFVNRGFFDRQGRLLETQAVGRDITERKQAEEVLRASEARFRSYFESVTTGICITSPTAEWLEVNQRLCAMLGYSEAELRKTTWAQLTYPADLAPDLKQYKRVLAGEIDGYALEKRFVCKNGEIIWASLSVSCVRRADGQVDYFVGLLFDITARKQAEAASRASEEKFQRLFGTVADAVLLFDAQTRRILEVNDAMLRMYGYSREEALRLTAVELSAQPEATSEALQRAAAGLLGPNLRALHRKRDGTVFPVQISASTFEFQDRRLVCLVVRDITRELELEKEILAISEREQQRFARDVHDDLCQHLTGIQFLASTLAADLKDLARPESAGARRIAGLTRQALQKARSLSHGLAPVELEHGGLAVALRRLCLQVQSVFRCQCQLHCDLKVALPPPATAIHLYRIVQEAVSNAVRHGRASRIQITLAARPQGWALKIADNGRGFGKPKKTGAAKPGMGLRVMQYRAGMIGGTLAVRPRPRAGTEVICTMTGGVVPPARRKVR